MEKLFQKMDNLGKMEQNELLIAASGVVVLLMYVAYKRRKGLTNTVMFFTRQLFGPKKPYHPSFKDRPNVRIK